MKFKNILGVALLLALLLTAVPAISQNRLLIIAPDEFIDELEPLKRFKDCSGRPTILLSLTQVYQDYTGRDEPERIKRCIAAYEKSHNIQFVLLVGDCDKFPVRFVCIHTEENSSYNRGFEPADLYYADLYDASGNFDDWDIDNDSLYAERNYYNIAEMNLDQVNFYPDIAVGRVPASNSTELTTYVEKIIRYELVTYQQNWFKKALLLVDGGDNPFGDETKKEAITIPYLSGYAITKLYQDQPPYNAMTNKQRSAVLNTELNKGAGFVNFWGHGDPDGWSTWYDNSSLSGLTNKDKLPVVVAIGCETAQYVVTPPWSAYVDVNGNQWKAWQPKCDLDPNKTCTAIPDPIQSGDPIDSMAEYFLVKSNTDGIGYVGFTSTGHPGYSEEFDEFFFKAYGTYGHDILGDMWKSMMEQYVSKYVSSDGVILSQNLHKHKPTPEDDRWHYNAMLNMLIRTHLFGDPSLVVGGAFTITLSGNVYHGNGGPLKRFSRYRITGDVTVPAGQTLTIYPAASILFGDGKKITAMGAGPNEGLIVNATSDMPVCFMSLAADPQAEHVVRGMKVSGQLRVRNAGEMKLYDGQVWGYPITHMYYAGLDLSWVPPDLSAVPPVESLEDLVKLAGTAKNTGDTTIEGEYWVSAYLDGEPIYREFGPALEPGEETEVTFSYDVIPGDHVLSLVIDSENQINETDEENNVLTVPFTVPAEGPPGEEDGLSVSAEAVPICDPRISHELSIRWTTGGERFTSLRLELGFPDGSTQQIDLEESAGVTVVNVNFPEGGAVSLTLRATAPGESSSYSTSAWLAPCSGG